MILVTGGTGYIGRYLVNELVRRNTSVRVLVRDPARAAALPAGVGVVCGDLRDQASLRPAIAGVRAIVHLAGLTAASAASDRELLEVNRDGTASLVRAAGALGVDRLVHVSTAGVYGIRDTTAPITEDDEPRPMTGYQRSKLASEDIVRAGSVTWTILRPSDVFGPGRRQTAEFLRSLASRRFWLHSGARTLVNPVYVADVVAAILLSLESAAFHGQTINVAGPRPVEYRRFIDITADALGRRIWHLTVPHVLARAGGTVGARLYSARGRQVPPRLALLSRPVINRGVSTEKAARLGFVATPLEHAMAETVRQLETRSPSP